MCLIISHSNDSESSKQAHYRLIMWNMNKKLVNLPIFLDFISIQIIITSMESLYF